MKAKEYLEQTKYIDMRIHAKLQELETMEQLLLLAVSADGTVGKITALREEINRDIDELVDQKSEAMRMIGRIGKPVYKTLLELRYIRRWSWKKIEANMHYSPSCIYNLHSTALKELDRILEEESKTE